MSFLTYNAVILTFFSCFLNVFSLLLYRRLYLFIAAQIAQVVWPPSDNSYFSIAAQIAQIVRPIRIAFAGQLGLFGQQKRKTALQNQLLYMDITVLFQLMGNNHS